MLPVLNFLPAILGFTIGLIWITHKLGLLKYVKINDKCGIIIPCLVTIALPFIFTYISLNFSFVKELAQLGIFFTIAIAFLNYFSNQKTKRDEEITRQAILALERAFEILTDNGKNIAPPLADRLNWLTTARMLARYEKFKRQLTTELYRTICEEQEEYWRHEFYLLIEEDSLYPLSYFENAQGKPIIQPKSALIIFGFAGWKQGKIDPLKTISTESYLNSLSPSHQDLNDYLSKYPKSIE